MGSEEVMKGAAGRLRRRRVGGKQTRRGVQSVEIGFRLVETLAAAPGAMSLKALSAAAKLTSSKSHRYLASFMRCELVVQDPATGLYNLGPAALQMGFAAMRRIDPLQKALTAVQKLSTSTGSTTMLTTWGEHGPVILRWVQGLRPVYSTLHVGMVVPLLVSATGHVYLAYMPRHVVKRIVAREQRAMREGDGAGADVEAIAREVAGRGFGRVRGDLITGLSAAAAPVFDGQGSLVAVLTLVSTMALDLSDKDIAALKACCSDLSRQLGWQPPASDTNSVPAETGRVERHGSDIRTPSRRGRKARARRVKHSEPVAASG